MHGKIYCLTSNFLIIPNPWLFNKSVHLWAREWYWHRNDHIFVFLSKLTMLYLRPKVSALFSCMWCKPGKLYVRSKGTLVIPHLVFILINCLTFTLKGSPFSIVTWIQAPAYLLPEWSLMRISPFSSYINPTRALSGYEHVTWHDPSTCLHAHVTCIITSDFWLCEINQQSQTVTQVPVLFHRGNILIALSCNSNAHEIRFTFENQFCQNSSDLHFHVNIL